VWLLTLLSLLPSCHADAIACGRIKFVKGGHHHQSGSRRQVRTAARRTTHALDHTQTQSVGSPVTCASHRCLLAIALCAGALVSSYVSPLSIVSRTGRGAHPVLRRPVVNPLIVWASVRRSEFGITSSPAPIPLSSRGPAPPSGEGSSAQPMLRYRALLSAANGVVSFRGFVTNVRYARFA
jgi:hypothetical protein